MENIPDIIIPKNFKHSDKFFQNRINFFTSYFSFDLIPTDLKSREIAVLGRSNVGKSSLINALAFKNKLAYTSKRPGCTVSVNFYKIDHKDDTQLFLVDLPGYGYAKKNSRDLRAINFLVCDYILQRPQLKLIYLLIDSRVGIQKVDSEFINFFHTHNISYQIVLTKTDKAKASELASLERLLESFIHTLDLAGEDILKVSAHKNLNVNLLRYYLMQDFLSQEDQNSIELSNS